jgi:type IV secretory pathway VirB2 component (pilin)
MSGSLFDARTEPVLPAAAGWVTGTLFGDVAVILCVLAVAFVGLLLIGGRLAVRDAVRVIVACFVLLGAPVIAAGLRSTANDAAGSPPPAAPAIEGAVSYGELP